MNITGEGPSPEVVKLDQNFFPHPWSDDQWKNFDPKNNLLYVLRISGVITGFALYGISDDTAHLYKILLHPSHRGNGTAEKFWTGLSQELKTRGFSKIYLEVAASNLSAVGLYTKVGMKELRRIKGYYSNGEDALTMIMML